MRCDAMRQCWEVVGDGAAGLELSRRERLSRPPNGWGNGRRHRSINHKPLVAWESVGGARSSTPPLGRVGASRECHDTFDGSQPCEAFLQCNYLQVFIHSPSDPRVRPRQNPFQGGLRHSTNFNFK